ncbi:DUF2188 domain-containing protein [Alkalihalophilus marmarensis]|jgi:uncharacterized protein YdaT|uniref:DUF2188 domain-containing protein n=1 Tax=Alkalihalophilus marmarensis TaxID=521377 RepID=UPI00203E512E|nr:DUF2188 domain-containing protein [Alkalihalophilus marmarensis]MCM3491060.1 DUF2188 domain-containing protein [Alkalihalophilus marmarensis]
MPWNKNDYPDSMKNLNKEVREKAIEIANSLVEDGYEEGRAIPIAIDEAEKIGNTKNDENYQLMNQNDQWAIKKEGAERASKTFETKEEALKYGDELLAKKQIQLKIYKKDGSLERTKKYSEK